MVTQKPLFYWIFHRCRLLQAGLLLIILAGLFFRVFPLEMQKRIVNTAIHLKQTDLLIRYCLLYLGAVLLAGILKYAANVLQKYLGQKILLEIRTALYAHILQLPLGFFRRTPPGTVITAMTGELGAVGHFIGGALAVPVTAVLTLLAFAGYMIWLDPMLGVMSIALYPLELVIVPILQRRYNRLNTQRVDVVRSAANTIGEAVSGIHEIQGNAGYRLEGEKAGRRFETLFSLANRLFVLKFGIKFTNNLFQNIGPFILFLVGGYLAIHGRFTLGALVAFLSAYEKIYDPWKELIEYYQELQDARVRYRRVMACFDATPEFEVSPVGREIYPLAGRIQVNRLEYAIEGGMALLKDINFELSPGEQMALVGFSGSGKSTLAMLVGQLYRHSRGRILIDGRDISTLTKADVSRNIGFVAQHPFIFDGSVRENLLYAIQARASSGDEAAGSHLPDRSVLLDMVRKVGLGDDVVRWGLNTVITEGRRGRFMEKVFEMRRLVHEKLVESHSDAVEFYDVNQFLRHVPLFRNLLFGDGGRDGFTLEGITGNRRFMRFLRETDLEEPLVRLGWNLARETVHLLQDLRDDDFFFGSSPIPSDQFDVYRDLVSRLEASGQETPARDDRMRLLDLALGYIPARHKMAAISERLAEKILAARHRFIQEVAGMDIAYCREATERFIKGEDPGPPGAGRGLYCPTEYLFSRTVMENIVFGTPRSDDAAETSVLRDVVVDRLSESGLLDDIMELGLDFQVGSKGDRLSGGQRQKIAIARAFLKGAPILILDEATASLDNTSQGKIQRYLERDLGGKTTVIAVLHRLDLTRTYDRIAVLRNGAVVESGTFAELMAQKGAFYELFHGQG
ncbi:MULTISPECIES: ATP-binding cassette domain-containing protein [Desulfococcus]|uniref:ABC transporter transmembrane region n=1 Tax=Desulfococcus multivorans DSM 2059 TaxID=1121405 RepID=S7U5M1_DESML|nr:ABC transporter ATP-binding protein/permease [Desulfococcus multivorans]AOY60247.1 putative ABC transporter, ATP-binding and permease domain [Desulfococcus multivorans]AQV02361.1 ABC transporter ATP-binding protein [Desulfococcus multivorans]EPR44637.1 ABC transporter transmembrane region [Desulfococcus multivorans DSM 2059]SKA07645.1 putative ABC transport system ATP-binding protein [Desulfococcus multivorans DSM 2059]